MDSSYIISAHQAEQLPPYELREIGVLGRSNCGKSSLLNALFNTKKLVKTGSTPGHTQMINFFRLRTTEGEMIFADLPGYGYSATGKGTRKHWESLIDAYVERENIKEFMFLVDCRRAPQEEDRAMFQSLAGIKPTRLIITKSDKLNQSEQQKSKSKYISYFVTKEVRAEGVHIVSALNKKGIDKLRDELYAE
jgi:GTP-binding protein